MIANRYASGAVPGLSRRPAQRSPQLVGDLIEHGPPGTGSAAASESGGSSRHQPGGGRSLADSPASSSRSAPYWRMVSKAR